jgi:hypothetical protein
MAGDQSEVARLRQRIEEEYQAAQQAVSGFRQAGKHEFITASLDRIGNYQTQLATLIGEEESVKVVCQIFDQESPSTSNHTRG